MIEIIDAIELEVAASDAWEVVADYRLDVAWRGGVLEMAPTPSDLVEVGTTTYEVMRVAGRTLVNRGLVTSVEPGRSFSWETTDGAAARGSRSVVPLGPDRCRVELALVVRPRGADRLLAPMFRRILRRGVAGDLTRLEALVVGRMAIS